MPRRLVALVLMLTVMSAPVALAVCHVECAEAASHTGRSVQHSCHESSEPAAVSVTAVPHFCGHTDEAPAGLERAQQVLLAPVMSVALAVWAPPAVIVRVVAPAPQHSPPRTLALLSQLRV